MTDIEPTTSPVEQVAQPETTPEASAPVAAAPTPESRRPERMRGGFRGGRGGGNGRGGRRPPRSLEKPEFDTKTLDIARVTRVTKGGKRFSFRTTVVIGDGKGRVSVGMGKGRDVAQSIQKATNQAKKHLFTVVLVDGTIPHQVEAKYSSARVILKPGKGGVKAGGPVRVVAKLAGIQSLTGKVLSRGSNKINIARATVQALLQLRLFKKPKAAPVTPETTQAPTT